MMRSSFAGPSTVVSLPEAERVAGYDQLGVLVLRREVAEEGNEFIGEVAVTQLPIAAEMEVADEIEHARHEVPQPSREFLPVPEP